MDRARIVPPDQNDSDQADSEYLVGTIPEAYSSWGWFGPCQILLTNTRLLVVAAGPASEMYWQPAYRRWCQSLGVRRMPSIHQEPLGLEGQRPLIDTPLRRVTKVWTKSHSLRFQRADESQLFFRAPLAVIGETPNSTWFQSMLSAWGTLPLLSRIPYDFVFPVPWPQSVVVDFLRKTALARVARA